MASVPCVQLRADRLTFSTDGQFADDHANVRCALAAGEGVLSLSGSGGAPVVLRGLASPTSASAAVSVGYSTWKAPVRFVTTAPLSVTSPATGVLTAVANGPLTVDASTAEIGDRVLVAGQSSAWQNGIYVVAAAGAVGVSAYRLERALDFDDGCRVAGSAVVVLDGSEGNSLFINTNNAEPAWTTADSIAFEQVGAAGGAAGGGGGGGASSIAANSVGLAEMEHGPAGGEVLFYSAPSVDPQMDRAPARLALGPAGYPLVAGAAVPGYAQLGASGLAADCVTTAKLADGAVTAAKLGAGAVTEAKLADGAVTTAKLGASAVTEAKLGAGAVTSAKLGALSVTAGKLAAGAVTAAKLATGAVTEASLANGCVTAAKLAAGAVTAAKLAAGAVTEASLANGCVSTAKIATGAVSGAKLADGAVDGAKLNTTLYKTGLILGTEAAQEFISFAVANEVGMYVNNTARLRATTAGGVCSGTWTGTSDLKWKDLKGPVSADPLAALDCVDGHAWTWRDTGAFGGGVVAQEFQEVCASAVTFDEALGGLTVNYNAVIAFNLCCNKALKGECARLAAAAAGLSLAAEARELQLAALRQAREATAAQLAVLRTRVAELEAAVAVAGPRPVGPTSQGGAERAALQ